MGKLHQLNPASAELLLQETESFSASLARLYAREEFVFTFDDWPLIAFLHDEPILGFVELCIPYIHPELERNAEARRKAIGRAFDAWPEVERALIWMRLRDFQPSTEESSLVTYVDKRIRSGKPMKVPQLVDIRPVDSVTERIVWTLLCEALLKGYRHQGYLPNPGEVRVFVENEYADLASAQTASSVVAFVDDKPVGHATWREHAADMMTEAPYTELVDIFVIEDFAQRGIGGALTRHVEHTVTGTIRGHVVMNDEATSVLGRLASSGWMVSSEVRLLSRPP